MDTITAELSGRPDRQKGKTSVLTRTELTGWGLFGLIAVTCDLYVASGIFTGRYGDAVQAGYRAMAGRFGGVGRLVALAVCFDMLLPPVSLAATAMAFVRYRNKQPGASD
jgi:uncharacterized membrane protein